MIKRYLLAIALACALAGSVSAQNTTTFGNIVSQGTPCGSSNCVYYQLPPATHWVSVTVSGAWSGTLEAATTSAPNASYQNLDTLTWSPVATETANGVWTIATGGSTFLRVRSTNWTGGPGSLARVAMDSTLMTAPLQNPVFLGNVTASGLVAPSGGSAANCWQTNGGSGPCAGGIGQVAEIANGESTIAGAVHPCTSAVFNGFGTADCGVLGDQDYPSLLRNLSFFKGRVVAFNNNATGGTTCAQMLTNWNTTSRVMPNYAPGGSQANGALATYDVISTGINDGNAGTTLPAFQQCLSTYLQRDTATNIIPILVIEHIDTGATNQSQQLQSQYADWEATLKNKYFVYDSRNLADSISGGPFYSIPVNLSTTIYHITNYQVTNTAGAATIVVGVSDSSTNVGFLNDGVHNLGTQLVLGGFNLAPQYNNSLATFVSSTACVSSCGPTTFFITLSLAESFPSTGLISNEPSAEFDMEIELFPGGKHWGIWGDAALAQDLNTKLGQGFQNTPQVNETQRDTWAPRNGLARITGPFAQLCIDTTQYTFPGNNYAPPCNNAPGSVSVVQGIQNLNSSLSGFWPGIGSFFFGGAFNGSTNSGENIRVTSSGFSFNSNHYTGPSGAIGFANPHQTTCTGYNAGDTGFINGGSGTAHITVLAVSTTGCPLLKAIQVDTGGSGYTSTSGAGVTNIIGTGTGLTLDTLLSADVPFFFNGPGTAYNGGSVYVAGVGCPTVTPDTIGSLSTCIAGSLPISSTTAVSVSTGGSGCPASGTINIGGGAGGTASFTATAGVLNPTLTVTGIGHGYTISSTPVVTSGSTCTVAPTVLINSIVADSGIVRFGGATSSNFLREQGGTAGLQINSGGPIVANQSVTAPGVISSTNVTTPSYHTTTNCTGNGTAASPSVVTCAAAPAGAISCSATASAGTCTVNTTAVTTNSQVVVQPVSYLNSRLGVTCNTALTVIPATSVTTIVGGTSFTFNLPTYTTNPACFVYTIVN